MAGRDNRGGFRPLGLRLQRFSRRIIRNYINPTAPGTSSPDLPPRWTNNASEPLLWRTTDTAAPAPAAAPSIPDTGFDAPPVQVVAQPRRAPAPRVENSIDDEINPMLLRILEAHETQRGSPMQRKTETSDASTPPPRRNARNRMSVDYVETSTLKGDDAPKSSSVASVQRETETQEEGSSEDDSEDSQTPSSGQAPPDNAPVDVQRTPDTTPPAKPRRAAPANRAPENLADAIQRAEAPAPTQPDFDTTTDIDPPGLSAVTPVQRQPQTNTPRQADRAAPPPVQRQPEADAGSADVDFTADTPAEAPIQRQPQERRTRQAAPPIQRLPDTEADAPDSASSAEPEVRQPTTSRWNAPIQRASLPEGNLISDADAGYDLTEAESLQDEPVQQTPPERSARSVPPVQRQPEADAGTADVDFTADTPAEAPIQRQPQERRTQRAAPPIQRLPDTEADAPDSDSSVEPEVRQPTASRWNAPIQRATLPEGNLISDADAGYDLTEAESLQDEPVQQTPPERSARSVPPVQRQPEADAGSADVDFTADTPAEAPIQRQPQERRTRRAAPPIQRLPDTEADAPDSASSTEPEVRQPTASRWNAPIQRASLPEGNLVSDADADFDSAADTSAEAPIQRQPQERRTRRAAPPIQRLPDPDTEAIAPDSDSSTEPEVRQPTASRWNAPIQRASLPEGNLISDADAGYDPAQFVSTGDVPDLPQTHQARPHIQRSPSAEDTTPGETVETSDLFRALTESGWGQINPNLPPTTSAPNTPIQRRPASSDADIGTGTDVESSDLFRALTESGWGQTNPNLPPTTSAPGTPIQRRSASEYADMGAGTDVESSDLFRALTESGWGQTNPNLPPTTSAPIQRTPRPDANAGTRWNSVLRRDVDEGDHVDMPANARPTLAQIEAQWAENNPETAPASHSPASDAAIQRTARQPQAAPATTNGESAPGSSDPNATFHAEALRWLNMPANTPIARKAAPSAQPQASASSDGSDNGNTSPVTPAASNYDDEAVIRRMADEMVQRAVVVGEIQSEVNPETTSGEGGNTEVDVESLAQRVFKMIRQRLRVEQERRRQY